MNISGDLTWRDAFELDQAYFPRPWHQEQWTSMSEHHLLIGHRIGSELAGMALFGIVEGDDTAHLLKIVLHPSFRGSGESIKFWGNISAVLKGRSIKNIFLEVEETNLAAQKFYAKVGFKKLRLIKNYYSDGTNALSQLLTL